MTNVLHLGTTAIRRSCRFTVIANDRYPSFKIQTTDTTSQKDMDAIGTSLHGGPIVHYRHIWCFDGTNTYTADGSSRSELAFVWPGFRIEHADSFYELLWLAFVPNCYSLILTNSFMSPIWPSGNLKSLGSGIPAYNVPVHFAFMADSLGFFRKLIYMNVGVYRGYGENGHVHIEPLNGPYAAGYTNAIYEVLSETNTQMGFFPKRCGFTRFDDVHPGYTGPLNIIRHSEVTVNSIMEVAGAVDFRPSFKDRSVLVYDYRVTGKVRVAGAATVPYDYIKYAVSNNEWPSPAALVHLNKATKSQIRGQYTLVRRAVRQGNGNRRLGLILRYILWFAICSSFAVIVIVILKTKKKGK